MKSSTWIALYDKKWGTECLNTRFLRQTLWPLLPTLLGTGHSMKLKNILNELSSLISSFNFIFSAYNKYPKMTNTCYKFKINKKKQYMAISVSLKSNIDFDCENCSF